MKRIVVPTDFSDCAMSALKVAATISDKTGAVISLVHTYELPVYGFTSGHLMYDGEQIGNIKKEIEEELQKIAHLDFVKKHTVEKFLLPDSSIDEIVSHKVLKNADMIVMGSHGTSGWREDIIGSNTERIIRKAKCPVLVVQEKVGELFEPASMVFASSFFGEVYDHFPAIKKFAEMFGTKIHLLRVNTPSDFLTTALSEKLMNDFMTEFKLKNASIHTYNDQTVEDGVINFSKRIGADIIAMETHGRTGINHIVNGSIAEDIANHAGVPMLTFRIKKPPKPQGTIFPEI
ncbi:MAG: universal stress protein [Vicingaceae bacterium]